MARQSQIQDLARGVKRGGLSSEGGITLSKEVSGGKDKSATEGGSIFLNHFLISVLLSWRTKQDNQQAAATKISARGITGDKTKPKLIASPTKAIKLASAKKNNEKAREETARSNLFVAVP